MTGSPAAALQAERAPARRPDRRRGAGAGAAARAGEWLRLTAAGGIIHSGCSCRPLLAQVASCVSLALAYSCSRDSPQVLQL